MGRVMMHGQPQSPEAVLLLVLMLLLAALIPAAYEIGVRARRRRAARHRDDTPGTAVRVGPAAVVPPPRAPMEPSSRSRRPVVLERRFDTAGALPSDRPRLP